MIGMHRLLSWRSPAVNIALAVSMITAATDAVAQPMAERPTPFLVQKSRASTPNDRSPLSTLVAEALENSPLVTAAREDFEAMVKVPVQEATLPEPEISLQNMAVGNPVPGNRLQTSDFAYFGYGFSQEIPFPAKLATRSAMARKEADAARINYEAVKRRVVAQVRESYFNLYYLKQSLRLLDETEVELGRIEAITESQYRLGAAQQQDVLKAQAKLTALEKEMAAARQNYEQGQAALKAELGREQDSAEVQVGALGLSPFNLTADKLRSLALASSPVLRQAQAIEARSAAALRLARQNYLPDFSFAYMYQKTGARFPDYYLASVAVKIPLYFWRRQTPAFEQTVLEKGAAHARVDAARLSVLAEAQNQWIAIQTTRRTAQIYADGLIPQTQATLTSALAAYRVGKVDFQTLLSAEIDVLELRRDYYGTIADHEIAIAKVEEIVGDLL